MSATSEKALVVITCSSGRQNTHMIPHLYDKENITLRLVVHSHHSLEVLYAKYPHAEIVRCDLTERSTIRPALFEATHVYHVGPTGHHHETQIGYNIIDAAVEESQRPGSKFKHFVYSSVLNTQLRKLLNHDCKRYVEEYLMESGLNWTILKPTNFMDPAILQCVAELKMDDPVFTARWSLDNKNSLIALRDLGEAGAKVVLEGKKHWMAEYPLCSTGPTPYREIVDAVSKATGREFRIEEMPFEEEVERSVRQLHGAGAPKESKEVFQRIILYYRNRGIHGNPNVLEWLLGRKPTSVEELVQILLEPSPALSRAVTIASR